MNHSLRRSLFSGASNEIIETNDDAAELRNRRRQSNVQATETTFSSPAGNLSFRELSMSAPEAFAHYTNCLKLSTENKITVKNAFHLQLIDYMSSMLRKKDSRMENFQVASSTLDASAKIYAARVDRIHGDGLRFATGLGMLNSKTRGNANVEKNGADVEVKSRRLLHKKVMRTIAENTGTLDSLETEKFCCDSGLLYMKYMFGQSRPGDANFLRKVSVAEDSCKLQLLPSEIVQSKGPVQLSSSLKFFPELPAINNLSIGPYACEPADMDEEISFSLKKKTNQNDNVLSLSPASLCDAIDMNLDDNLDTASHDIYDTQSQDHDSMSTVVTVCPPTACRANRQPDCIFDITKHLSKRQLEYSYFDIERLSLWAGPTHWKLPRLIVPRNTSREKQERKRAKKKVILFTDHIENLQQYFIRSKNTVLCQKTMEVWDSSKLAFEKDVHYSVECLSKLFLRQCELIEHSKMRGDVDNDDNDISNYDYNIHNDSMEFCPNVVEEPDVPNLSFISGDIVPLQDVHNPGNLLSQEDGWKMLTPPRKIARFEVPYAHVANKIDMKKLKAIIWEILTDNSQNNPVNYFSDASYSADQSLEVVTSMQKPMRFSYVIKKLSQVMFSDLASVLNIPIIFNSVLHLANEKNLSLEEKDVDEDILIKQHSSTLQ